MRFLFTVQPATGHLNPVLPTALRLQSLGHDVRVASSATFAPEVENAGLPVIIAGRDWLESDSANTMPEMLTAQLPGQIRLFAELADEMAEALVAQEFRPDLVVRETVEFGGALVAHRLGVPCVVSGIGLRMPERLLEHWAGEALRAALSKHAPGSGLELFDGDACLTHLPPSWAPDEMAGFEREHFFQPGSVGTEQALLPECLGQRDRSRPLIYASLGTVFNDAPQVFRELIRAAQDQPFDLLLALGRKADPAAFDDADNVYKERYVAQDAVLREVDAVVCHGGMGTVTGALTNGLPLCVIPFSADQPLNAMRSEQLGCGRAYTTYKPDGAPMAIARADDVTAGALREHMNALIEEPSYRLAAEKIADEIAALPGVDGEVELLTDLAVRPRSIA